MSESDRKESSGVSSWCANTAAGKPKAGLSRRGLLGGAGALAVGSSVSDAAEPTLLQVNLASVSPPVVAKPTRIPTLSQSAAPVLYDAPALTPASRHRSTIKKDLGELLDHNATNQGGAWWSYDSFITPIDKFFVRNEYSTPRAETDARVHKDTWRLRIHGDGVERALTITYNDLLRMPTRTMFSTLECAGNGRSLFWEQQNMVAAPEHVTGTGWGLGGIGQAEWRYVPMSHILGLVGVKPDARQCLFWSGVDNKHGPSQEGDSGRPLPMDVLLDNADTIGIAFKMNGADLTADHGAPVRAFVAGWCGAGSTKWLTEIKISRNNFWVRLNTSQHVLIGPKYPAPVPQAGDEFRGVTAAHIRGQAVTWSPPKSFLSIPLVLQKQAKLPHNYPLKAGEWPRVAAGERLLTGYASGPQYGVARVDVRVNGDGWERARLLPPNLGRFTWMRFEMPWTATPGRHVIETRVIDHGGQVQPATVPYNEGGFDFWAIPKFQIEVA